MIKVLAVGEDPVMLKILQLALAGKAQLEMSFAVHPDEGVRKVRSERPDLIILDLFPPEAPWLRVLTEAKAASTDAPIAVLVLTLFGREDRIKFKGANGASECIEKGAVSLGDLITKIEKLGKSNHAKTSK